MILTGPPAATAAWRGELAKHYLPAVMSLQQSAATTGLPAMLARPSGAHPQAWVCHGSQCLPPITDIDALLTTLA